jgi:molybdate transport system substrate-binding protein
LFPLDPRVRAKTTGANLGHTACPRLSGRDAPTLGLHSGQASRRGRRRYKNLVTSKLLLFAILLIAISFATAQELTVAAAADLSSVLPEIAAQYKKQTGQEMRFSFGSSGNLTTQIQNGAPFDIFFSADEDYPKQLIEQGLAEKDTLYRYAVGRLVVWVPKGYLSNFKLRGIATLDDPACKKIAIANPKFAPYGRAAEAALQRSGVYDAVAARLVIGENVSQASQFLESGNATCGLIPLSHALKMKNPGEYWAVPLDAYPPLKQTAVVLTRSRQKAAARKFLDFVRTSEATSLLNRYGFSLP